MESRLSRWVKGSKKSRRLSKNSSGQPSSASGNITLVKGSFSPSEAADVLLTLINDKIKFHSIQILNLREGSDKDISYSEERIKALKAAKIKITDMVVEARNKGLVLDINSSIDIQMRPRPIKKESNP